MFFETLKDKFFYFFRNLFAFILGLPFQVLFVVWQTAVSFVHVFILDGSILVMFPWEYDWLGFRRLGSEDEQILSLIKKKESLESEFLPRDDLPGLIKRLILYIGDCPNREGLIETPVRVQKAMRFLYSGYGINEEAICKMLKTFKSSTRTYDQIILIKNIEMYSTCEHHLLPFFGVAHVAYIPDGDRVVGASKLPRLVEAYSRRLQIQEDIGEQITAALMKYLKPKGAACIIEAKHMCMMARGVEKQKSTMVTSSLKGVFIEKPEPRQELMELIK
jgi:GTP cyclohydrolase IA